MKLQKNNKYVKRLTAGLMSAILSASILSGCTTSTTSVETSTPISTEVIESATTSLSKETPIIKDNRYFLNYYKLSDEEYASELSEYNIKYPDVIWRMNQISSLVVEDNNNNLKVLQVIEYINYDENIIYIYDVFTEEFLFSIPYASTEVTYTNELIGLDFSTLYNAAPYFENKKVIEYGLCCYANTFVTNHINYIREKDGIDYIDPKNYVAKIFYPNEFMDGDLEYNIYEIAKSYIISVPEEYRVTSKELGVMPTYKAERKYADFWKISDDEVDRRVKNINIINSEKKYQMSDVKSLIVKDSNNQYYVLNVTFEGIDNTIKFYDLYSEEYLFTLDQEYLTYIENITLNADFTKVIDKISFFDDKEFVNLKSCLGSNNFVSDYIKELSNRDGIKYDEPDDAFFSFFYPRYDFKDSTLFHTKEEIAKCYVKSVPEETQITYKNLTNENDKVLVK